MGRMCDLEKGTAGGSAASPVGSKSHASSHNLNGTPHSHHNVKNTNTSLNSATSSPGLDAGLSAGKNGSLKSVPSHECPICYMVVSPEEDLYPLSICKHAACKGCLERYLKTEINESRTDIACPQCSESMHPSDIQAVLRIHPSVMAKYEDFMVRRVLLNDPDSRWCPSPNCTYAVIASGCASCLLIRCQRPGCLLAFCYHCKAEWHPDQTCDAARASRHSPTRAGSITDSQHRDDIKPCPRCQVLIVKMNDGSCNHMVCAVCGSEFCWLCMKEISDLHYLSPSGCTFWGKKPWSRKKKLMWQLGTLVGAPVGIALVAGIAVPAMIIGIPVWVGRKIHTRFKLAGKHKRNCAVLGAVTASVLVAPVLAAFAVAIGVPILLFYVYGVVPVSLCRAGCGVSTGKDGFKFDIDEEDYTRTRNYPDAGSVDAVSRIGATSIGEVSLSVASGPLGALPRDPIAAALHSNRDSTIALAGSIGQPTNRLEVQADVTSETASTQDAASTKALAGSIISHNPQTDSEDGASVRFDKSVSYIIEGKRDADVWFMSPEQDHGAADKLSLCSGRSLRSSERSYSEEMDSMSLTSAHKRTTLGQRLSKLNSRNMSSKESTIGGSSNCIAENVCLEITETSDEHPETATEAVELVKSVELQMDVVGTDAANTSKENQSHHASTESLPTKASREDCPTDASNMSKTAILRNIFFSQIASTTAPSPSVLLTSGSTVVGSPTKD